MRGRDRKIRSRSGACLELLETRRLLISVGPDGFGYEAFDHTFQPVDLVPGAAGVVNVVDGADDGTASIPLGTNTVKFYGTAYTGSNQLYVNSNGLITFAAANNAWQNSDLISTPAERAVAVLWDDWRTDTGTTSAVLYKFEDTTGDSVPDRLIVEWNDVPNLNAPSANNPATFQAIIQLNPASGQSEIILNFPDLNVGHASLNNGASATVGIKDAGSQGENRLLISRDTGSSPFVATGKAIRIAQNPNYGTVAGIAFNDLNANGVQDGAEAGLANWTIYLDADNDAALDPGERATTTDAAGNYQFGALLPGTHRIRQVVQPGWQATAPASGVHVVSVSAGQTLTGFQFGARALPGEIRGTNWNDLNGNAVRDAGEPGLAGWTIYLDIDRDGTLDAGEPSTITDVNGDYAFPNLPPGTYVVAEVQQAGWEQTFPGGAEAQVAPEVEANSVAAAIERASDLSQYTKAELASATSWVVGLKAGRNVRDLAARVGSSKSAVAERLADTFILEFPPAVGGEKAAARLKRDGAVRFFYPLIARQQQPRFVSNVRCSPVSGI